MLYKNIAICLFISLTQIIYSSDIFYSYGDLSYFPTLIEQDRTDIYDKDNLNFYTSIGVGLEYKFIYAEAELNTYMVKADSYMFQPYTQEYLIRAGLRYNVISIQYEHLCAHSIDGYGDNYGYDKVSIMFDTRNR